MVSLNGLKKKLFNFNDVVELHFTLMNIAMLVREKYEEGGYHCFCDSCYNCCCLSFIKCCFKKRSGYCTLCKIQSFFYKRDAVENMSVMEFLDRNSSDKKKLKQLPELIWPFIRKIYFLLRDHLEFFDQEYVWTHRDWNTFEVSELPLREIIEYDKHLIELNGPERYYAFTYGR